jgi:hypothetical protein
VREALEHTDRVVADGDDVAQDQVGVGATMMFDVRQDRIKRELVAVDA